MAEEKPSTCIAAQLWVSDQRSRWNDLGSLHLADIDLMLDKQLQWISDHSNIESLLKLVPSKTDSISPNVTTLSQPLAPEYTQNVDCTTEKEEKHTSPAMNVDDAPQCDEPCKSVNDDLQISTASATVDVKPVREERDKDTDHFFIDANQNRNDPWNDVEECLSSEIINIDENKHKEEIAQLEAESVLLDAKPKENDDFLLSWPIVPLAEKTKTSIPDKLEDGGSESHAEHAGPQETEIEQSDSAQTPAVDQHDTNDNDIESTPVTAIDQHHTNSNDIEPAQSVEDISPINPSSSEHDILKDIIDTNDVDEVAAEPQPRSAPRSPEADENEAACQLEKSILYIEKLQEDTIVSEKPPSNSMFIIPSLESGLNTNAFKSDAKDDVFEPQEFHDIPTTSAFTEPSPPERINTIVELSPAQENIPPGTTPSVTQPKPVSSVGSSGSHFDDDDDDEDEIILVGDKSSTRLSRPTIRRVSKMPTVDRTRPARRTVHVPERHAKPIRTITTPITKSDNESGKGQPQSSTEPATSKTKTPVVDKVTLPLDEHETSNILWVSSSDRPTSPKSIDENQSNCSSLPGSTLMAKLQGVHTDKSSPSKQTSEDDSPIEKLQKRLDEVLQDVDRNSVEINKSLSALHKPRQYPNSKMDMTRSRLPHHMSPTMSHLKRLEVQQAMHHKLQAKLMSVQPTSHSSINKDKYSTNAPVYTSGWQARPEVSKHQTVRKKRLGILNGMNAERLKLMQQRSKLQERDLQGSTAKGGGNSNIRPNAANARDTSKMTSLHSFAKSTLSTQLKTHKPVDSIAKTLHSGSTVKHLTVNASKAHESIRTKPMAPTDRLAPASYSSSQHATDSAPATPSKKNAQLIPNAAADKNKASQEDE
ncbi:hypothetical protein K450DRAFT_257088 [Umbelopsis ramanniana AG]|uniref:Uncharacterized protein n=1 Tax=Umbelopsis ramanniana AG TaxID=1314678 RepID=A0AAD5E498_UMBRA|nr:uncharacterized protein K450DRAFT_257088 [Umbelopsis ramanniana AG]KAI8576394.1 hypothetical protein K450DRAFT_257088 [Umbelopsis ramanniana AG]